MSTFRCDVVPVELLPHPNADSLSIVQVGGYTVCVRTADWLGKDRGVYIPPDSVCPQFEPFLFLGKQPKDFRVRVKRLRNVYSQGLLMPAPDGAQIGEDMSGKMGITHYEPPIPAGRTDGNPIAGPPGLVVPKYDVENWKRYPEVIPVGEPVYITEKIHGCNARYVFHDGVMYCGSRTEWKEEHENNLWWSALRQNPWIEDTCMDMPDVVLFGEVFGHVQDLRYGTKPGEYKFLVFDVLAKGKWLDWKCLSDTIPPDQMVPALYGGKFHPDIALTLAECDSSLCPGQCREGVVICTQKEQTCHEIGRLQLKIVSNRYLERS